MKGSYLAQPRVAVASGLVAMVCLATVTWLLTSRDGADAVAQNQPSPTNESCNQVHAGHSAMMWNPVMADEMVDAGCPWPYEPFVPELNGGTDDPELDAPFEAVRYDSLTALLRDAGLGVCSVGTQLDGLDPGVAFAFEYQVAPTGCPDSNPTGSLTIREYATEAQRDDAAHAEDPAQRLVLGRWVVFLDGDAQGLTEGLRTLGAQAVT